jgi:hypothetical protein
MEITSQDGPWGPDHHRFCLGDMFDSYTNPEETILAGLRAMEYTDWCLAGNHDLTPAKNRMGSLELLMAERGRKEFAYNGFGDAGFHHKIVENCVYLAVPHCTTQDLFEESLEGVIDQLRDNPTDRTKFLLLHTNYASAYADGETELNLTRDDAQYLLESGVDYIVLGHEHNPRQDLDGRVIVLGNVHPTGFSDISDKRVMTIDDETGEFRFDTIWSQADRFVSATAETLDPAGYPDAQFVRVDGFCSLAQAKELSRVVKQVWANSPGLMALRVAVEVEGIDALDKGAVASLEDLPTVIAKELEGSPAVAALWEKLLKEVTE